MIQTNELGQFISTLFGRKLTTIWSEKEMKSYRKLVKNRWLNIKDLELIERYYVYQRKKGEKGIHRRDLYTFLNNFTGELDRAKAWDEEMRERHKRLFRVVDSTDEKPVNDEEFKRLGDLAREEVKRWKMRTRVRST